MDTKVYNKTFDDDYDGYLTVTADMSLAAWNTAATHEVFTVTGTVRMKVMPLCTATLTDAADGASMQLGIAGTTNAWIASTGAAGAGGNTIEAGELWIDATPADTQAAYSAAVLDKVVAGGLDVGYEITGAALTGGKIVYHCWWKDLDGTGNVVAGAGGTL